LPAGLSPNKLNELYHRSSSGILENHINDDLQDGKSYVFVERGGQWVCTIYIYLYDSKKGKIGHISLHINPENNNIKNLSGRLHVRNNKSRNRKYPFIIEQIYNNLQNTISIKLNTYPKIVDTLKEMSTTAINILTLYFNPKSDLYLSKHLTPNSDTQHPCLEIVKKNFEQSKQKKQTRKLLQITRKQHWKR
jgi:hypothetical protein